MSEETAKSFKDDQYLFIKEFIDPDLAKLIYTYTLYQQKFNSRLFDTQVPNTHSVYGDHMMEALLEHTCSKMQDLTGEKLFPTNTYYRVYKQGDILKHHVDRASCEISATVCLGYDNTNLEEDYNWKLWVNNTSNGVRYAGDPEYDVGFEMKPGDAVVYEGTKLDHWRDKFKGTNHSQVFFHYIRQDGPFGKYGKYDCRPGLGYPERLRDPELYAKIKELDKLEYEEIKNK